MQKLFSWRRHNFLPLSSKQLEPKSGPPQDAQEKLINSKQKQAFYYTLKSKARPELQPRQTVKMKRPYESTWTEAVCKKMIDPHSYVVVSSGETCHQIADCCEWCQYLILCSLQNKQASLCDQCPCQIFPQLQNSSWAPSISADPLPVVKPAAEHVELVPSSTVTRSGCIFKRLTCFQELVT